MTKKREYKRKISNLEAERERTINLIAAIQDTCGGLNPKDITMYIRCLQARVRMMEGKYPPGPTVPKS